MIVVTVTYPVSEGSSFDLAYYQATHIPLVKARWVAFGLGETTFLYGAGAPGDGPSSFHMIALLPFPTQSDFLRAAAQHGKEIMSDIKNFTPVKPMVQFNEVIV